MNFRLGRGRHRQIIERLSQLLGNLRLDFVLGRRFERDVFAENAVWRPASLLMDLSSARLSRNHFLAFFHVVSTGRWLLNL